jgi:hypothetical protein
MTLPPQIITAIDKVETFMEKYPTLTQNGESKGNDLQSSRVFLDSTHFWIDENMIYSYPEEIPSQV